MKRGAALFSAEFGLYFPSNWVAVPREHDLANLFHSRLNALDFPPTTDGVVLHHHHHHHHTTYPPFCMVPMDEKNTIWWTPITQNLMGTVHQLQSLDVISITSQGFFASVAFNKSVGQSSGCTYGWHPVAV